MSELIWFVGVALIETDKTIVMKVILRRDRDDRNSSIRFLMHQTQTSDRLFELLSRYLCNGTLSYDACRVDFESWLNLIITDTDNKNCHHSSRKRLLVLLSESMDSIVWRSNLVSRTLSLIYSILTYFLTTYTSIFSKWFSEVYR